MAESTPESSDWIDRLVKLEEQLRNGALQDELEADIQCEDLRDAHRLLQSLQRLGPVPRESSEPPAGEFPPIAALGKYRILELQGAGGFGIVYRGRDDRLQRDVAIKIPAPQWLQNRDLMQRFLAEARAVSRLDHPAIVPTYEAGETDTVPYIVSALCTGPTLAAWIAERKTLGAEESAWLTRQLAAGVHYSHQLGILHRDIKPANVLLFPSIAPGQPIPFQPRLTDFGLAKVVGSAAADSRSSQRFGTPLYLAPEQIGASADSQRPTVDVFGLGAVLYECLTGQPPFQGQTIIDILSAVREARIAPIRALAPGTPPELIRIVGKALSAVPQDRYPSAAALHDDLDRFLRREPIEARSPGVFKRMLRYSEQPRRVVEAAAYTILCNLAILGWITIWPLRILFQIGETHGTTLEELLPYTAPLIFVHLGLIGLGVQVGRRKLWAAVTLTIVSFGLFFLQLSILLAWITPPYPSIYPNARSRDIVFSLLETLFFAQAVLSLAACRAIRCDR